MGYLVFFVAFLIAVVASLLATTVAGMGYAEQVNGQWALVSKGWAGALGYGGYWAIFGAGAGALGGWLAGSHVWTLIQERSDQELEQIKTAARQELERAQTLRTKLQSQELAFGNKLLAAQQQGANLARAEIDLANARSDASALAERKALAKIRSLEAKLQASQSKGLRLKQSKAKLMSAESAKPLH